MIEMGYAGSPFNRIPGRITVHEENPNYSSIDGVLYNKDTTTLIEAPIFLSGSFVVPKTVTSIETYAFQNDTLLTSIELPASIAGTQPIKNSAFSGCSKLKQLIVRSQTPPDFTSSQYPFNSLPTSTCVLYVPKGTVDAYKAANQWKNFTTITEASLFYDLGNGYSYKISANGKYITGYAGFVWENKEDGDNTVTRIPLCTNLQDVNDFGVIIGKFQDSNYIVNGSPIESGGVYKDGAWISLGLGRYGATTNSTESGSSVNAITNDGWVFGMAYEKNSVAKVIPIVWKPDAVTGAYTDTLVYRFPDDDIPVVDRIQGTRFLDASAHGEIASGWAVYAATHGTRRPIIWRSPTDYKIINPDATGEAHGVSPNGKYVTLTTGGRAALYDVDNDSLIVFGQEGTTSSDVSDDGLVVGFRSTVGEGRKGFLWSDKLGYIELKDFIEKYTPEIILSQDFQFSNNDNDYMMDVPMSVSADGLIFTGWRGAGIVRKIWVVALPAPLDLVSRPHGLTASVDPATRNVVELSWSAPTDLNGHNLDYYNIYREGQFLAQVDAYDPTVYVDNDAPSGHISYSVSAVYDVSPTTPLGRESNPSESIQASIIDNYNLPFYDGFDSGSHASNYWTTTSSFASTWRISDGYQYPGYSTIFLTSGDQTPYSQTITSKPLDATGQTKVTASFIYQLNTSSPFVGVRDTIYFEVSSDIYGTTWNTVKPYIMNAVTPWTSQTLDITDLVKGKVFRARFRAVSGANRTALVFYIDEFSIAIEPVAAPGGVKAIEDVSGNVQLAWQDPSGSYGLTYAQSSKKDIIGNEGVPFIAVNKFDLNDIATYKGLKLTSISAYINGKGRNATTETKIKLAVFVDNTRVRTQEVTTFEENAWNTFLLDEPIDLSSVTSELAFGIDVVEHDASTLPLATDYSQTVKGKGDAFSEDGGNTWESLTDWDYAHSWCIIGNVRAAAAAATETERTQGILGYEIYRDDVKINAGWNFGQAYVDTTFTGTQASYVVKAFYSIGGLSDASISANSKSANAVLSNLTVSEGTLTPAFNDTIMAYTVAVANSKENITITGTAAHSSATVSGNGAKSLNVGNNSFDIVVTAENEITTKTYTVAVIRNDVSGLENINAKISVYPNPTTGKVYIKNETGKEPAIIVTDLLGNKLLQGKSNSVDFSAYPEGVYLLNIDGKIIKIMKK
jgi:hypothetical protein